MNTRDAVVVVGYEAITCLGASLEDTWRSAMAGASGITTLDGPDELPVRIGGRIVPVDFSTESIFTSRELQRWTSPVIQYGVAAALGALRHAGVSVEGAGGNGPASVADTRVGITFGTALGGLDQVLAADRRWVAHKKLPKPFMNPNACVNMVTGAISMRSGARGPSVTPVGACATGSLSIAYGAMLLERHACDVVIAGAVDFPLEEIILAGFATMNGAFTPKAPSVRDDVPQGASRPFSLHRRGFVVSEGAAALVLTRESFALERGLTPRAWVRGVGMTSDAHHPVASHTPTVCEAIRLALHDAGLRPQDIDIINAHAASTKVGDRVEAEALREVFGATLPPITAPKSQLGHAMGAASAIEAVLICEGLRRGEVPPTLNHQHDPNLEIGHAIVGEPRTLVHRRVLHNAFGFGGCNCVLVLEGLS